MVREGEKSYDKFLKKYSKIHIKDYDIEKREKPVEHANTLYWNDYFRELVCERRDLVEKYMMGPRFSRKMYEEQLMNGKAVPVPREEDDRVIVTVSKLINNTGVFGLIRKVAEQYHLTRKEKIALGLIAQNHSMTASAIIKQLDLRGGTPYTGMA